MSKKSSSEKKLCRKRNQEKELKSECVKFDIFGLLREQNFETKPETGEFLKKYVKSIRILVEHQKVMIYPVVSFEIGKVFVDFLDGHQIIAIFNRSPREYYIYDGVEELDLKEKERKDIIKFIEKLQEFSFIHN